MQWHPVGSLAGLVISVAPKPIQETYIAEDVTLEDHHVRRRKNNKPCTGK